MHAPKTFIRSFLSVSAALAALSGCRIEKPATVVPPPPTVEAFTSSAPTAPGGGRVTLSWKTSEATRVELREASTGVLNVPVDNVSGSFEVTIDGPSLFVLIARGPGGADARAVSVGLAGQELGELTFQALPPTIEGGGSSTLAWTAPRATTVTLTAGGQNVDIAGQRSSGAVTVSPRFDTTYTLTADGVMKTATVTVQAALLSAEVTPASAQVGNPVTLRWTAAGADRVVVSSPGRGQLFEATTPAGIASGSFVDVVPPTPNDGVVSYEIAAVKGTVRFTRNLEVSVGTGLAITRFEAPAVAAAGASYGVRWQTRAADQVELKVDGVTVHRTTSAQAAALGGFGFTAPSADFSVELIATNTRGARVSQLAQVDAVGIPTAATLTANPTTVAGGQPVTLTFASQEARRVRITDSLGQVVFSVTGQMAETGTATVYPSVATTYTLSADNLLGSTPVTATAAVTVTGAGITVTQFPPTALSGQNVSLRTTGELLYGFPHTQVLTSSQADFLDISTTGARVLEAGADVTTVNLPFTAFVWGQRRTGPLTISRAGWIAWGAPLIVNAVNPISLPSITGAPGLIAPFWDDLRLLASSAVYAQVIGNAPDQSLVVQWQDLQVGASVTTRVTFQVRVHQRGMVSFHYPSMQLLPGYTSFAIGVQDETKQLGLGSGPAPAQNSALYFFSPVAPPVDVRVARGSTWGGYVKSGSAFTLVTQAAGAFAIPIDISFTELMFRPHAAVIAGQYVELTNRTLSPLDLSGWELRTPTAPAYFLPSGFLLQPNVPTVIGTSTDPALNDDAGVALGWNASGFFLSEDAGSITIGTADAGAAFTYSGPADAGRGQSIEVDPGPFIGTTGPAGLMACAATATFGGQTPQQLGSPGSDPGCGFGYTLRSIAPHFVDISDGGTALINSPTATVGALTIPITLAATGTDPAPQAFGARRDIVSMSLDGWLVWGNTALTVGANTTVTSTTSTTRGKLAVFWDDLETSIAVPPASELYWKRFAANEDPITPAQHWVFQWSRVRHVSTAPADVLNFEIKLFEDGVVEYHYGSMQSGTATDYANGNSATIWLENPAGDRALVVGLNQAVIRPNTAFRFVPR